MKISCNFPVKLALDMIMYGVPTFAYDAFLIYSYYHIFFLLYNKLCTYPLFFWISFSPYYLKIGWTDEKICREIDLILSIFFSGTDIKLWHGKTGKTLGNVDTNQLKNTMATISPNGRFIAAAAFTADVKVTFLFQ